MESSTAVYKALSLAIPMATQIHQTIREIYKGVFFLKLHIIMNTISMNQVCSLWVLDRKILKHLIKSYSTSSNMIF